MRDIASAFARHGHTVAAYSNVHGEVAEEIQRLGIPVFSDVSQVPFVPDIIHGQHHLEAMTALLQFPGAPAVYFCHGFAPWEEIPPKHPRIMSYVAVDQPTYRSCIDRYGIPEDRIRIILNFVDLDRFKPRSPLPPTPRRALIFSNQARERNYVSVVRQACLKAGMEIDVRGMASGAPDASPETLLGHYDIVFAKARCALEAMAVGTAVVLCDAAGIGPMVSTDHFDELRLKNFGHTALVMPVSLDAVLEQIGRYDSADATEVSARIRSLAGLERVLPTMVSLYRQAIAGFSITRPSPDEESLAVARYLGLLSDNIKQGQAGNHAQELEHLRSTFVIQFRERVLGIPLLRSLAGILASIGKRII